MRALRRLLRFRVGAAVVGAWNWISRMAVESKLAKSSRAAAEYVSPGRQPWVKREIAASPGGTAQVLTQPRRGERIRSQFS